VGLGRQSQHGPRLRSPDELQPERDCCHHPDQRHGPKLTGSSALNNVGPRRRSARRSAVRPGRVGRCKPPKINTETDLRIEAKLGYEQSCAQEAVVELARTGAGSGRPGGAGLFNVVSVVILVVGVLVIGIAAALLARTLAAAQSIDKKAQTIAETLARSTSRPTRSSS